MPRLGRRLRRTRETPIFGIGAASRLTGLPVWTLRWIERQGLLRPSRTAGRQRAFSQEDMEALLAIRSLMERHVNAAGIRIILTMRRNQGHVRQGIDVDADG